jgi:uncharacterized protein (DUF427 family)
MMTKVHIAMNLRPFLRKMSTAPLAPRHAIEDVWNYPRPPLLQRTPNLLQVIWTAPDGTQTVLAETDKGYRVCETSHPPTYYLPRDALRVAIDKTGKTSFCEWKGGATYWKVDTPGGAIGNRVWSYEKPTRGFEEIKGYLSFYASDGGRQGGWKCFVDGEEVGVQEG